MLQPRYARGVTSYNGQTYCAAILCTFNCVYLVAEYMQDEDLREQNLSEVKLRWFYANTSSLNLAVADEECGETKSHPLFCNSTKQVTNNNNCN